MTQSPSENEKEATVPTPPSPSTGDGDRRLWHRRRLVIGGAALLLLLVIVVGFRYYRYAVSHESTDDAFIDGRIIAISPRVDGHVAKVLVIDNQKVVTGDLLLELDPRDFQARLNAARASLDAAEADRHSQDIDVSLTSITTAADLEAAKATVAAAEAMVENASSLADAAKSQQDQARAQVSVARAALAQSQAEIKAEEARYQETAQDLKRYQEMSRSNTVTPQQLDHAVTVERMAAAGLSAARSKVSTQQAMVRQAEAALKAATDNLGQVRAMVTARQAELDQAKARLTSAKSAPVVVSKSNSRAAASRADVEKARADVEQAVLNLSYTRIYAPTDGYVTKKSVEPGTFVQVGQSLMAIVSPEVWVSANYKETQLTHMRPGQTATIEVDMYPQTIFHGRVESIQRGTGSRFSLLPPENATGNYVKVVQRIPVKIVFDQIAELSEHLLVPGMSVIPEVDITSPGHPVQETDSARQTAPPAPDAASNDS